MIGIFFVGGCWSLQFQLLAVGSDIFEREAGYSRGLNLACSGFLLVG